MSLKRQAIEPVPKETAEVDQAAFPKGNTTMKMQDELGVLFAVDKDTWRGRTSGDVLLEVSNDRQLRRLGHKDIERGDDDGRY